MHRSLALDRLFPWSIVESEWFAFHVERLALVYISQLVWLVKVHLQIWKIKWRKSYFIKYVIWTNYGSGWFYSEEVKSAHCEETADSSQNIDSQLPRLFEQKKEISLLTFLWSYHEFNPGNECPEDIIHCIKMYKRKIATFSLVLQALSRSTAGSAGLGLGFSLLYVVSLV